MKNLLIYINPKKDFDEEGKTAVKIQIDNSLDLGWKPEDILLVTNFDYEYNNVKSYVVGDKNYCEFCPAASKINAIIDLFDRKLIEKDKIYWFHDIDAFQLCKIEESELKLNKEDILMPDFGRILRWSTGSFFFKTGSENIFNWVKEIMYKYKIDEESAFCILTGIEYLVHHYSKKKIKAHTFSGFPEIKNINQRIKKANITYNFHSFNVRSNYKAAIKPIRVAHFHFLKPINPKNPRPDQIDFFLHGKNKLEVQIVPERLVKIFNQYGVR